MSSGKADSEVRIKFKTEHDGSGAEEANRKLDDTKKKSDEAAGGFGRAGKAALNFKGMMEKVNSAMAGFGVMAIISQILKLAEAIAEARRKHDDMVAGIGADNAAAGVARLKGSYDGLKQSIADAAAETAAMRENTDLLIDAERRLQDASLSRREEDEVAALDKNDPLLKEKEAAVRAKYSQQRSDTAGRRRVEDVNNQEKALREEIASRESRIRELEQAASESEAAARDYSGRAAAATKVSVDAQNSSNWFTARKGENMWGKQLPEIEQYAGYAGAYTKQASGALAVSAAAQKDAESERAAIKRAQDRLAVLPKVREAAAAEGEVETRKASRASDAAGQAVADAERRRERERRDLEQARRDRAGAEESKRSLEGGLSASKNTAERESQEAWRAKQAMEAHEANRPAGGGGNAYAEAGRSLRAAWEREQSEANAAAKALDAMGESTAKSLQAVASSASAAAAKIKSLEAKLNRDPYGDKGAEG